MKKIAFAFACLVGSTTMVNADQDIRQGVIDQMTAEVTQLAITACRQKNLPNYSEYALCVSETFRDGCAEESSCERTAFFYSSQVLLPAGDIAIALDKGWLTPSTALPKLIRLRIAYAPHKTDQENAEEAGVLLSRILLYRGNKSASFDGDRASLIWYAGEMVKDDAARIRYEQTKKARDRLDRSQK